MDDIYLVSHGSFGCIKPLEVLEFSVGTKIMPLECLDFVPTPVKVFKLSKGQNRC